MVILNTEILICKNTLTKSIKEIMNQVIEEYFEDEKYFDNIEKKKNIMKKIVREKVEHTKSNHFWYLNSSPNVCTFIHQRGKKEGYMCHKHIRTNLNGQKQDYLCSTHSKKHIPKKRNRSNFLSDEKNISKMRKDVKKIKKKKNVKNKTIYVCNSGNFDIGDVIKKLLF